MNKRETLFNALIILGYLIAIVCFLVGIILRTESIDNAADTITIVGCVFQLVASVGRLITSIKCCNQEKR